MGVSTKSTQAGQFNQKSRVKPRWQLIHNHQNFVLCPIQLSELINQHIRVKKVRKEEERFEKHQKENHVFTRKQQCHFLQMITTLCMAYCYLSKKKEKRKRPQWHIVHNYLTHTLYTPFLTPCVGCKHYERLEVVNKLKR